MRLPVPIISADSLCSKCEPGRAAPVGEDCVLCEAGYWSPGNETSCRLCSANFWCEVCAATFETTTVPWLFCGCFPLPHNLSLDVVGPFRRERRRKSLALTTRLRLREPRTSETGECFLTRNPGFLSVQLLLSFVTASARPAPLYVTLSRALVTSARQVLGPVKWIPLASRAR